MYHQRIEVPSNIITLFRKVEVSERSATNEVEPSRGENKPRQSRVSFRMKACVCVCEEAHINHYHTSNTLMPSSQPTWLNINYHGF